MGWRLGTIALVISVVSTVDAQQTKMYELDVDVAPRIAHRYEDLSSRIKRCIGHADAAFLLSFRVEISGGRALTVSRESTRGRPRAIPCIQRAIQTYDFGRANGSHTLTVRNHEVRPPRASCMTGKSRKT